jgi:hypothetical protein
VRVRACVLQRAGVTRFTPLHLTPLPGVSGAHGGGLVPRRAGGHPLHRLGGPLPARLGRRLGRVPAGLPPSPPPPPTHTHTSSACRFAPSPTHIHAHPTLLLIFLSVALGRVPAGAASLHLSLPLSAPRPGWISIIRSAGNDGVPAMSLPTLEWHCHYTQCRQ